MARAAREGRARPWLAFTVAGITVGLFVAMVVMAKIVNHHAFTNGWLGIGYTAAAVVVGLVISVHQPKNPIGWLMMSVAASIGAFLLAQQFAVVAYRHHPLVAVTSVIVVQLFYYAFILLAPLVLLFFPEGRLPSPRWRPVLRAYLALAVGVGLVTVAYGVELAGQGHWHFTQNGNPASGGPPPVLGAITVICLVGCLGLALSWVVRRIAGYRRATSAVRQQYKWLAVGAVGLVVALVLSFVTTGGSHSVWREVDSNLSAVLALPFPVTVGVAIMRYRLYDIDRVISRTVSYALLTGMLVGLYAAVVTFVTRVLPFSSSVGVAASTLAAAAAFNPLRKRLQQTVDRRFNRARYDAEATVAAFSERLRAVIETGAVQEDLVTAVKRSLEPSSVAVWLRPGAGIGGRSTADS
jgi:hypothetical protein